MKPKFPSCTVLSVQYNTILVIFKKNLGNLTCCAKRKLVITIENPSSMCYQDKHVLANIKSINLKSESMLVSFLTKYVTAQNL